MAWINEAVNLEWKVKAFVVRRRTLVNVGLGDVPTNEEELVVLYAEIKEKAVNIPKESVLTGYRYDFDTDLLLFYVMNDEFPRLKDGESVLREAIEWR
jgi:hypothetical protein